VTAARRSGARPEVVGPLAREIVRPLAREDARRLLWRYHFSPGSLHAVARRLGTIQYDPLAPMGRNPDLVLQARVPGYRVDDWQGAAYGSRLLVDAWDKMVCLTLTDDWPARHLYHEWFYGRWRRRVFDAHPDAVADTLAELRARGPLGTLEFTDQSHGGGLAGSWYGPKLVKHVIRALWDSGQVVTHARDLGRHVYDLPERSLPAAVVAAPKLPAAAELERLVRRRVQAAGLLRPSADASVWFMPCGRGAIREAARALVRRGELLEVEVDGVPFLAVPEAVAALDAAPPARGARFLAPLDPLVWDRPGATRLYDFDYVWEVYKPEAARRWGYYVLPVLWGERFVARFDGRREGDALALRAWYWEEGVDPSSPPVGLADDLEAAAAGFLAYLGVRAVRLPRGLGRLARGVWQRAQRRVRAGGVAAGTAATGGAA
jgi:uncharacterized protein